MTERDATSRVVVTAIGAVTPLGIGWTRFREALWSGASGVRRTADVLTSDTPCEVGGAVDDRALDAVSPAVADLFEPPMARKDRFLVLAITELMAGLPAKTLYAPERLACVLGTSCSYALFDELSFFQDHNRRHADHHLAFLAALSDRAGSAGRAERHVLDGFTRRLLARFGWRGRTRIHVEACAASALAIGDGLRMLRSGAADACVVGGFDSMLNPIGVGIFSSLGALSQAEGDPAAAIKPFDRDRDGMLVGEGAALLLLEREQAALERGAEIICELAGVGASNDAHSFTAPDPQGRGAAAAMRRALLSADAAPRDVDYINAHGTATELNDRTETLAIKSTFGAHAHELAISSSKPLFGHLIGASGAIEALVTIAALRDQCIPPTRNLSNPDELCDLDYVSEGNRKQPISMALSNSFGFGGVNGSIALRRWPNQ